MSHENAEINESTNNSYQNNTLVESDNNNAQAKSTSSNNFNYDPEEADLDVFKEKTSFFDAYKIKMGFYSVTDTLLQHGYEWCDEIPTKKIPIASIVNTGCKSIDMILRDQVGQSRFAAFSEQMAYYDEIFSTYSYEQMLTDAPLYLEKIREYSGMSDGDYSLAPVALGQMLTTSVKVNAAFAIATQKNFAHLENKVTFFYQRLSENMADINGHLSTLSDKMDAQAVALNVLGKSIITTRDQIINSFHEEANILNRNIDLSRRWLGMKIDTMFQVLHNDNKIVMEQNKLIYQKVGNIEDMLGRYIKNQQEQAEIEQKAKVFEAAVSSLMNSFQLAGTLVEAFGGDPKLGHHLSNTVPAAIISIVSLGEVISTGNILALPQFLAGMTSLIQSIFGASQKGENPYQALYQALVKELYKMTEFLSKQIEQSTEAILTQIKLSTDFLSGRLDQIAWQNAQILNEQFQLYVALSKMAEDLSLQLSDIKSQITISANYLALEIDAIGASLTKLSTENLFKAYLDYKESLDGNSPSWKGTGTGVITQYNDYTKTFLFTAKSESGYDSSTGASVTGAQLSDPKVLVDRLTADKVDQLAIKGTEASLGLIVNWAKAYANFYVYNNNLKPINPLIWADAVNSYLRLLQKVDIQIPHAMNLVEEFGQKFNKLEAVTYDARTVLQDMLDKGNNHNKLLQQLAAHKPFWQNLFQHYKDAFQELMQEFQKQIALLLQNEMKASNTNTEQSTIDSIFSILNQLALLKFPPFVYLKEAPWFDALIPHLVQSPQRDSGDWQYRFWAGSFGNYVRFVPLVFYEKNDDITAEQIAAQISLGNIEIGYRRQTKRNCDGFYVEDYTSVAYNTHIPEYIGTQGYQAYNPPQNLRDLMSMVQGIYQSNLNQYNNLPLDFSNHTMPEHYYPKTVVIYPHPKNDKINNIPMPLLTPFRVKLQGFIPPIILYGEAHGLWSIRFEHVTSEKLIINIIIEVASAYQPYFDNQASFIYAQVKLSDLVLDEHKRDAKTCDVGIASPIMTNYAYSSLTCYWDSVNRGIFQITNITDLMPAYQQSLLLQKMNAAIAEKEKKDLSIFHQYVARLANDVTSALSGMMIRLDAYAKMLNAAIELAFGAHRLLDPEFADLKLLDREAIMDYLLSNQSGTIIYQWMQQYSNSNTPAAQATLNNLTNQTYLQENKVEIFDQVVKSTFSPINSTMQTLNWGWESLKTTVYTSLINETAYMQDINLISVNNQTIPVETFTISSLFINLFKRKTIHQGNLPVYWALEAQVPVDLPRLEVDYKSMNSSDISAFMPFMQNYTLTYQEGQQTLGFQNIILADITPEFLFEQLSQINAQFNLLHAKAWLDALKIDINILNAQGENLVFIAVRRGASVDFINDLYSIFRADIALQNANGESLLDVMLACSSASQRMRILDWLMEQKIYTCKDENLLAITTLLDNSLKYRHNQDYIVSACGFVKQHDAGNMMSFNLTECQQTSPLPQQDACISNSNQLADHSIMIGLMRYTMGNFVSYVRQVVNIQFNAGPTFTFDSQEEISNQLRVFAQQPNNFYSFGKWDDAPYYHPVTNEPVFVYRAYQDGQEVGAAHFYERPILCRSKEGNQHNLFKVTGIFSLIEEDIHLATASFEEVCAALPPSIWEEMSISAMRAAQYGALRGVANTVEYALLKQNVSALKATIANNMVYYGSVFALKFYQYSQVGYSNVAEAAYNAAWDTGTMFATQLILREVADYATYGAQKAKEQAWNKTSQFCSFVGRTARYGTYAYDIWQRGATNAATAVTGGIIAEKTVEAIGKGATDFFSNRLHALMPKVNSWFTASTNASETVDDIAAGVDVTPACN